MRVALFFVAFSFLFAFVLPQLVSTLFKDDDQVAWQLMQGADPTTILEETASGIPEAGCGAEGYLYYQNREGFQFIRNEKNPYILVLIGDKPIIFRIKDESNDALPVDNAPEIKSILKVLETLLVDCIKGRTPPQSSVLVIHTDS
ncbi:hypothetical protein [Sedimenticola selenatireducens]|mgnify:CR=1 FL=1|uniref:Uncharacterized protein n=1 Tax=Sedimenticola selenatireducens TaxID=191960 RepID=A0A557SNJ0_9GAMM|nr:hypothetical protein [Sedimenticola selenatireducens]TVO78997.1 hypothetical protein FHP88_00075 [Sedimenticola selenatireducens]TVT67211.1 MAG: hypothetical protein FHK78_00320 [Sedimenticola selenatireducens]